jgi:hypothetical protein
VSGGIGAFLWQAAGGPGFSKPPGQWPGGAVIARPVECGPGGPVRWEPGRVEIWWACGWGPGGAVAQ